MRVQVPPPAPIISMAYEILGSADGGVSTFWGSCGVLLRYKNRQMDAGGHRAANFVETLTGPLLGSLSLRNFDGNLDRGIVSRNIGHVFIAQALDDPRHHLTLALSGLVSRQRRDEIVHLLPGEVRYVR